MRATRGKCANTFVSILKSFTILQSKKGGKESSIIDNIMSWPAGLRRGRLLGLARSSLKRCTWLLASLCLLSGCGAGQFKDGFETGAIDTRVWQIDANPECLLRPTDDLAREGKWSLQIRARKHLRCELVPRVHSAIGAKFRREPFGKERCYRFSTRIGAMPTEPSADSPDGNTIVAQWHASPDPILRKEGGRGPPLALRIQGGRWGITYGWEEDFQSSNEYVANNWQWIGPIETDRWIDWAFRVTWSYGDDGITEVWRDSELVMRRRGPNAYNDFRGVYLKLGLYHPTSDQEIYIDRIAIDDCESRS